ncbi:DUF397 domain-containing protein [Micromonospora sp. CB01531]|uniref:DUF397 domain-containing protein n=1 Tax=Micromonospora sp. CB01531 TaxID=1718947 RepID=UPI000AC62BD1
MSMSDAPNWHKSTRSGSNVGDCLEAADNLPGRVLVRDIKDRTGGTLTFGPTAWSALVTQVSTHC